MTKLSCLMALLLVSLFFMARAMAQPALEKLRVTYSAIGGSQSSVWMPYEAGIFRKHGLDVELLYVGGGERAGQGVQSGEVPIGFLPEAPSSMPLLPAATWWQSPVP